MIQLITKGYKMQHDNMKINNILSVLWAFESAPSAHCLVKSIAECTDLSDDECSDIHEYNDSYNELCTHYIVKTMSDAQLTTLVTTLLGIDAEYRSSYGDDYNERVNHLDVPTLLS